MDDGEESGEASVFSLDRIEERPLKMSLGKNAGEDAAVILNQVKVGKGAYGYNADTAALGDMLEKRRVRSNQGYAACACRIPLMRRGPVTHDRGDGCRGSRGRRARPWRHAWRRNGRDGYVRKNEAHSARSDASYKPSIS